MSTENTQTGVTIVPAHQHVVMESKAGSEHVPILRQRELAKTAPNWETQQKPEHAKLLSVQVS